jgi:glutamyl-Q tRNA(Asp) synthetase
VPSASFVTRFAPSPTGRLHLGHAYSALTAFDAAKAANGRFILRIEDIDHTRARPEFEAGIYEDLAWLGLEWETPVRRQSEHLNDYEAALARLEAQGLIYRCFKTRKELAEAALSAPHGAVPALTPGPSAADDEARWLAEGRAFAWRLSLTRARDHLGDAAWRDLAFVEEGRGSAGEHGRIQAEPERLGDVVLARKDVGVAYHLAVVVDDAAQSITHVIRGDDLHEAAHIQRLLQALLGLPTPVYRHHHLLLGADGQRLAKRNGGETLHDLRDQGVTPREVRARLGLKVRPPIAFGQGACNKVACPTPPTNAAPF